MHVSHMISTLLLLLLLLFAHDTGRKAWNFLDAWLYNSIIMLHYVAGEVSRRDKELPSLIDAGLAAYIEMLSHARASVLCRVHLLHMLLWRAGTHPAPMLTVRNTS